MGLLFSLLCSLTACGQTASAPTEIEIPTTETTSPIPETEAITEPLMSHQEYLNVIREAIAPAQEILDASYWTAAAIAPDSSVFYAGLDLGGYSEKAKDFPPMRSINCEGHFIAGITREGQAVITPRGDYMTDIGRYSLSTWENMRQISSEGDLIAGIREDGTAVAAGGFYECRWYGNETLPELQGCKKIIAAGADMLLALTQEGTLEVATRNPWGICDAYTYDLSSWEGLSDVISDKTITLGIREDGTVLTEGVIYSDPEECYYDVPILDWTDIVAADLQAGQLVGLRADGTVCYADCRPEEIKYPVPEFEEIKNWEDIVAVAMGGTFILGYKADGTVLACGEDAELMKEISQWKLAPVEVPWQIPHEIL